MAKPKIWTSAWHGRVFLFGAVTGMLRLVVWSLLPDKRRAALLWFAGTPDSVLFLLALAAVFYLDAIATRDHA